MPLDLEALIATTVRARIARTLHHLADRIDPAGARAKTITVQLDAPALSDAEFRRAWREETKALVEGLLLKLRRDGGDPA